MLDRVKNKGVVYTPFFIVKHIVDCVFHHIPHDNPKVVDPACGTGNFLAYVADAKPQSDIYGFDCDENALSTCVQVVPRAKLLHGNSIDPTFVEPYFHTFDAVVGNPPYVRIQNLTDQDKSHLTYWQFAQGNTDLYIPFIELALKLIKNDGIVGYITPNTFLKNKSQKEFVAWLIKNRFPQSIVDLKHHQVFDDASTYSSIMLLTKTPKTHLIVGWGVNQGLVADAKPYETITPKNIINSNEESAFIAKCESRTHKLRDIAKISVGLATLADDIYFLANGVDDGNFVRVGDHQVEKAITRPCAKVGKLKTESDLANNVRCIIYPYIDGRLICEEELRDVYPGAYGYLASHKERLLARDKGKLRYPWYAYGRSQGITSLFGTKLLIPPIAKSPKFIYSADPDLLFISGYSIQAKGLDLQTIKTNLETQEFSDYIRLTSKDYQGGWKSCAKNMIQEYSFDIR